LFAQKISVTNILGGDKTETGFDDVLSFYRSADNSFSFSKDSFISDRFQVDTKSKRISSRVRTDFSLSKNQKVFPSFSFRGYGMFFPVEYFGFGAGNSFFQKYTLKGSYLGASDDSPNTGHLVNEGVVFYGIFPLEKIGSVNAAFSVSSDSEKSLLYNAGFEYELPEVFSLGAVFQNIKNKAFRYGVYSGLLYFEGFYLNTGFVFNFRDSDFLPFSVNSKNVSDEFNTEYALLFSSGYENKDKNFGVFADLISGVNNSYVKKSGKKGNYKDNEIPLFTAVRINYKVNENLFFETRSNLSLMIPAKTYIHYELYGGGEYKFFEKWGTVKSGARINFSGKEITGFSFPVIWKIKVSEK